MAIETKVRPKQSALNYAYAVMCLVFGLWGWYDYSIKIPQNQANFEEFMAARVTADELTKLSETLPLAPEQVIEFKAANEVLARFKEKPAEPAAYDRPVQLWLYIIGCGVMGVPWFLWAQYQMARRRYRLDDDGTFHSIEGSFSANLIKGIDLSQWMSKSTALVEISDGPRIKLDDYKYAGVEDLVAAFAKRFYPGEWTSDARPIGDPKSRDTVKAEESVATTESAPTEDSNA